MDGAVKLVRVTINRETTKKEIATSMTAGMRGREIRCVGMDIEYHIGCTVLDDGIWMGPHVVKELVNSLHGVFSWSSFLCYYTR